MLSSERGVGWRSVVVAALLAPAFTACSSATNKRSSAAPAFCRQQHPAADCVVADAGRFAVAIPRPVVFATEKLGVSTRAVLTSSLERIGRLLPGPRTNIVIVSGTQVIPGTGTNGFTDPATGQVQITLKLVQSRSALERTLRTWLPVALAHEVDHSVRIEAGPGFGRTLLEQLISEGMSSAFDLQVEPTINLPWIHALTAREEKTMWTRAQPLLNDVGLYDQWFFGVGGVPRQTGFQIGYHIVRDYLTRHPDATAAALVGKPAQVILSGSHYTP
jgi:Predicted Zn-dependent protease (DUF2268)